MAARKRQVRPDISNSEGDDEFVIHLPQADVTPYAIPVLGVASHTHLAWPSTPVLAWTSDDFIMHVHGHEQDVGFLVYPLESRMAALVAGFPCERTTPVLAWFVA